ncbi:MAG: MEDS domain-containing protein, partial [Nitrosopumilaceae archaeon]
TGKESAKNFLEEMKKDKHLLLVYENLEKAIDIQIDFLYRGLEKGECGIFAMPYKLNIVQKMESKGIDVEKYKNQNLLYIIDISEFNKPDENIFDSFSKKILAISKKPLRICAMLNIDLSTREGMKSFIQAETASHQNFESFRGSWLCSYDINKMEKEEKITWIKKLLKCHDSVIFAPSHESGASMDLV